MKMNKKKMVLILISFVFLIAMSFAVSALSPNNVTVVRLNVYDQVGGRQVPAFTTGAVDNYYFKGSDDVERPGGNYTLNITVKNSGAINNITRLNVSLPPCMEFILGTNSTNSSQSPVQFNFTDTANSDPIRLIEWNSTTLVTNVSVNVSEGNIIAFGFAINVSSVCNGNYSINISALSTGQAPNTTDTVTIGSGLGDNWKANFTITIDNTAPTISNITVGTGSADMAIASSNNTYVYIFFSETLNGTQNTLYPNDKYNNWSVIYEGKTYNVSSITHFGSGILGNSSEKNLTVLNLTLQQGLGILSAEVNQYNTTPTVTYLNFSSGNGISAPIMDLAGNVLANSSSDTALDKIAPEAKRIVSYTDSTREIVIQFTEYMDTNYFDSNGTLAHDDGARRKNLTGLLTSAASTSGNETTITLSVAQRNTIAAWSNISLNLTADAFRDNAATPNKMIAVNLTPALTYTRDTTRPSFSSAVFDANTNNLSLTFSEAVNYSSFANYSTLANNTFIISYRSNHNLSGASIGFNYTYLVVDSRAVVNNSNTTLTFTVNADTYKNISYWKRNQSATTLYISSNTTVVPIRDLANNEVTRIANTSATAISWSQDETAPTVLAINWSNRTLNARQHTGLITWSEEMNVDRNVTITFSDGARSYTANASSITNQSVWQFTLTPHNISTTSGTDGTKTITISGAYDDYNVQMSSTTGGGGYKFILDTTAPKLQYAYMQYPCFGNETTSYNNLTLVNIYGYIHNETGGAQEAAITNLCKPSLMLKFTENISSDVAGIDANTFYLNVTGDNLSGYDQLDINFTRHASKYDTLNITLNASTAWIAIRGRYNESLLGGIGRGNKKNSSGIDIDVTNRAEEDIVDIAGNPAIPNETAIDIADELVTIPASGSEYFFSIPGCVDSLETNRYLSTVTGSCQSYLSSWSTVSSGNLQPLTGYRCSNFASELDLPLYTKRQDQCTVEGSQVTLQQGWNLIGIDGWSQVANTTIFFNSLSSGGDVSILWKDLNTDPIRIVGADNTPSADYSNLTTIKPFGAYWVFTDFSTSTKNFVGRGIY